MQKLISTIDEQQILTGEEYTPPTVASAHLRQTYNAMRVVLFAIIGAGLTLCTCAYIPKYRLNNAVQSIYKKFVKGKVLDLSPKLNDPCDVALYENSRTIRVEYLINKHICDDVHYKLSQQTESDFKTREEERRAMTLDYFIEHDPYWYTSPVTFATVEAAQLIKPEFVKYDCVVIRNELMTLSTNEARHVFDSAVQYLAKDGFFIVMDVGIPHSRRFSKWLRYFNKITNSSMCCSHDYHEWIRESLIYDVVEDKRLL